MFDIDRDTRGFVPFVADTRTEKSKWYDETIVPGQFFVPVSGGKDAMYVVLGKLNSAAKIRRRKLSGRAGTKNGHQGLLITVR